MLPSGRVAVIASVLSGVAVGAAFGLRFGWVVTQLALVVVLWALDSAYAKPSRAAGLAAAFSFSLFATGFAGFDAGAPEGLRILAVVPWLGGAATLAAATALAAWLAGRLRMSTATKWLALWPASWVLFEWAASQGDLAIPWLRLGQQHAPDGIFAALLPIGGTLLVGMAMWWVAAALLFAARDRARWHRWLALATGIATVSALLSDLPWTQSAGSLQVALVQPGDKAAAQHDPAAVQNLLAYYLDAAVSNDARLLVTPQLAIPKTVDAVPANYWQSLDRSLAKRGADLLMGIFVAADNGSLYNAALSVGASGSQRYLKHQVFPFGESLPLTGMPRRWLNAAMPRPIQDTLRGPVPSAPLVVSGHRAALFICFEAAFPTLWREQAASAELLVNMSSDSALASPQIARQFQQLVQARALEFAKPLLRSSDVNGTYVIDHRGHVQQALDPDARAVLNASVPLRSGLTPFARFGDALPLALAALALYACAVTRARDKRSAQPSNALPVARLRSQGGQVILPALGLLLVTGALFYFMVNSSQAVNEKTRVINAADAAAYSAGVVEARALNFFAYTNRAMVANQIVIAQAVSVGSWMRYFGIASQNITEEAENLGTMFLPGSTRDEIEALRIGATFAAAEYVLEYYTSYTPNDYADLVLQQYGVIGGIVTFHNGISEALSGVQQLARANLAVGIRQQEIANDVVQAMDASLSAEVVPITHGFDLFSRAYSRNDDGGDGRGRFADVTMRSRDEFTANRSWSLRSTDNLVRRNGALLKRGGTDLVGFDEWRAVDTLELHGETFSFSCGRFGLPGWCDDIRRPIGWAGVNVNNGGGDEGAGYHGRAYRDNPTTADNADDDMEEPSYGYYTGLPTSQELDDLRSDASRTTEVTLMVTKRHEHMLTSGGAAQARPSGQLALFNDRPAGARMVGLSRAQVFFDRIDRRADGREEIGSLYNPYWRVRLVAPISADKGYAATQQGRLLLP
jgi:apolipoprotein N-acyltransferase